jgi:c(7)-type cytochrome triheme protein
MFSFTATSCVYIHDDRISNPNAEGGETRMKKFFVLAVAIVVVLAMSMTAFAVPSGKTLEFTPNGAAKVEFSGKVHADAGLKCKDCHPAVFKMKKGGDTITMKDINEGKFCGHCHNGTKAFSAKEAANCAKCHKK